MSEEPQPSPPQSKYKLVGHTGYTPEPSAAAVPENETPEQFFARIRIKDANNAARAFETKFKTRFGSEGFSCKLILPSDIDANNATDAHAGYFAVEVTGKKPGDFPYQKLVEIGFKTPKSMKTLWKELPLEFPQYVIENYYVPRSTMLALYPNGWRHVGGENPYQQVAFNEAAFEGENRIQSIADMTTTLRFRPKDRTSWEFHEARLTYPARNIQDREPDFLLHNVKPTISGNPLGSLLNEEYARTVEVKPTHQSVIFIPEAIFPQIAAGIKR